MSTPLTHNPKNAVTHTINRITHNGQLAVEKVLTSQNKEDTPTDWLASTTLNHWNYWQREALVYQSDLAFHLNGTSTRLANLLTVDEQNDKIAITLENINGKTGHQLTLSDYTKIALAWGKAQGHLFQQPWQQPWLSTRFLFDYTHSKTVDYSLLDDNQAWQQPLIKDNWPQSLRDDLIFLYQHRSQLYEIVESSERVPCHLDFWPNNVFLDKNNLLVPIDWAFFGHGAWGEDIANFIPDAVFDNFVPPEALVQMQQTMIPAYLDGVTSSGVQLDVEQLQTIIYACAVKYVWLGPLLLEQASRKHQQAYGGQVLQDASQQYRNRGAALQFLCGWAKQAISRSAH